jgi:hypothetical protein
MVKTLPQTLGSMLGTVHLQQRQCGRANCHCRTGERHPAYYLFWREHGKVRKRYLRASEVERVRDACTYRRLVTSLRRGRIRAAREHWRVLTDQVRGVEHHD